MSINFLLKTNKQNLTSILEETLETNAEQISIASKELYSCLKQNGTVFWCGNGGSAAEASHLATELIGRFKSNRRPLPSISLNSDMSSMSCIANDFGYQHVFSRQIEGLGKKNDLLVVLSTSGTSENICEALKQARKMGIYSIALLGKTGGNAKDLANVSVVIPSHVTAHIQETHLFIGHTLCEFAEKELGLSN